MGQVASRRRQHYITASNMKKKNKKKYPLEVWKQIKDVEINRLQENVKETDKEFEMIKKKMICQSFLLKEIFEDALKIQKEHHNKEIAQLKKEVADLQHVILKMKS